MCNASRLTGEGRQCDGTVTHYPPPQILLPTPGCPRQDSQNYQVPDLSKGSVVRQTMKRQFSFSHNNVSNSMGRNSKLPDAEALLDVPRSESLDRDEVFKRTINQLQAESCVGIAIIHLSALKPKIKLGMLQYIRSALDLVLHELGCVRVVKAIDERIFLASVDPVPMLQIGLILLDICDAFSKRNPHLAVKCSMGMDWGKVIMLPGDFYGDAASKLGEDLAKPGDLSLTSRFVEQLKGAPWAEHLLKSVCLEERSASISGVTLEFSLTTLRDGCKAKDAAPRYVHAVSLEERSAPISGVTLKFSLTTLREGCKAKDAALRRRSWNSARHLFLAVSLEERSAPISGVTLKFSLTTLREGCKAKDAALRRRSWNSARHLFLAVSLEERSAPISGVTLKFSLTTLREGCKAKDAALRYNPPTDADVHHWLCEKAFPKESEWVRIVCMEGLNLQWTPRFDAESSKQQWKAIIRNCAMLQSDMSGFTRLTRKYGIMHFMALMMQCRGIYASLLEQFQGKVVKYDGDNVITIFPNAVRAAQLASAVFQTAESYNRGLHKDYRIRLKFGLSTGKVVVVGSDMVGQTWDACCWLGEEVAEIGEILVTEEARTEILKDRNIKPRIKYNRFQLRDAPVGKSGEAVKVYNLSAR
eukprot:gene31028-7120_t